jgi:formylglycine-generating enzyme required for sulfatase activity
VKNPLFQNDRSFRVYRGGSWSYIAGRTRVSHRRRYFASRRFSFLGFRLFRTQEKA